MKVYVEELIQKYYQLYETLQLLYMFYYWVQENGFLIHNNFVMPFLFLYNEEY